MKTFDIHTVQGFCFLVECDKLYVEYSTDLFFGKIGDITVFSMCFSDVLYIRKSDEDSNILMLSSDDICEV